MKRWLAVLAIALAATALGACGGEEVPVSSGGVAVTATDFEFTPDLWSVPSGQSFDVSLINQGGVEHEWAILSTPIADEGDFTEDLVIWEIEADAGASGIGTAPPLDAGEYQIVCVVPGHFAAGMEGLLRVAG